MFYKKVFVFEICIMVVLLTACGQAATPVPPTNTPVPTVVPSTSTPLPTAIPLGNPTLTFNKGDCAYSGPDSVSYGEFTLDLVQSKADPLPFSFVLVTLQFGKTIADLKAWPSVDKPYWVNVLGGLDYLTQDSTNTKNISQNLAYDPHDPLYLVCFQQDAIIGNIKIGAFGPITVVE